MQSNKFTLMMVRSFHLTHNGSSKYRLKAYNSNFHISYLSSQCKNSVTTLGAYYKHLKGKCPLSPLLYVLLIAMHCHNAMVYLYLYLYLTQPELATYMAPIKGGEPAGGNKTGPIGSGDKSLTSPAAWPPQCSGVLIYGLARPMK